jgi:toxin ParE1/3/4
MTLPVILRPEAEVDIRVSREQLESVRSGLGRRFVAAVREVLERIEDHPAIYGAIWRDVRAARLKKFRYLVYYVTFADRVEVLAVMHGSRDEAAWQTRVGPGDIGH